MAIDLATATQNASADAVGALASGGTVEIRTGSKPGANSAATGTLLATVTLPSAGSAASGVVSFGDPAQVTPVAAGTAGWYRVKSSGAATVWDGTVTATGGGGDLTLATVSLSTGTPVDITFFTYTQPASA